MTGPIFPTFDCGLGADCTYSVISGYGLAATNRLVVTQGQCGDSTASSVGPSTAPSDGAFTTYAFSGFAAATDGFPTGEKYSVCWGHEPGADVAAHNVPVPESYVRGPYLTWDTIRTDLLCYPPAVAPNAGDCELRIFGHDLDTSNRLHLTITTATCGVAAGGGNNNICNQAVNENMNDCPLVVPTISNDDPDIDPGWSCGTSCTVATYNMGEPGGGGTNARKLCWAPANDDNDASRLEFKIEIAPRGAASTDTGVGELGGRPAIR
jgi:hypothetical protein